MDMQTIVCEKKKDLSRPKKHQFFQLRIYLPKFLDNVPWLILVKSQLDFVNGFQGAIYKSYLGERFVTYYVALSCSLLLTSFS